MQILWLCAFLALGWRVGALARSLHRHWTAAKRLQIPLILCPVDQHGMFGKLIRRMNYDRYLSCLSPFLPFLRFYREGWAFREKHTVCRDYGDAFALVTPSGIQLFIADLEVAKSVLTRGKDFPKPLEIMKRIDLFGKSLASVEGEDWKRHRRCTAAAFSDQVNETVWSHSCQKASTMLTGLLSRDSICDTKSTMTHLSFGVLMKACMGIDGSEKQSHPDDSLDTNIAEESLTSLLNMITMTVTVRHVISGLFKRGSNPFYQSLKCLNQFFTNLISHRKRYPLPGRDGLSSILALSEGDKKLLSDDEIRGNLFLLMFAGHETTANTLVYIIYLLAIYPEWQDWVVEALDQVLSNVSPNETPSIDDIFMRVPRLKALLYETLRLYGPVVNIPRKTASDNIQTVTSSKGSQLSIPGDIQINVFAAAIHTQPDLWGSDSLTWNPSRWILTKDSREEIDNKMLHMLLGWAEGPRACPGRKFSQLEMIAVLTTLLRQSSVELVPQSGMTTAQAQKDALRVVENSRVRLTLQIQNPELVHLRWNTRL